MSIINVTLSIGEEGTGIQTSFQMIAENNPTGQVTIAMKSEGVWPENWCISEKHAKAAFQSLFSDSGIPVTFIQSAITPDISIIPIEVWTAASDDVPKYHYWQLATNLENTGTWHWALYPAGTAETEIEPNGSGGWLIDPIESESGKVDVVGNNETLDIPVRGKDGSIYVLAFYQRVDGVDSNVVLQNYTAENTALSLEAASVSSNNSLILSFSKPVMGALTPSQWRITIGEDDHRVITGIAHVAGQPNVTIFIDGAIAKGETVTVDYTPGDVTDSTGNQLEAFSTTAVNSLGVAKVTFINGAVTRRIENRTTTTEELEVDMTGHEPTNQVLVMVGTLKSGAANELKYDDAMLNDVPATDFHTVPNSAEDSVEPHVPMTGYFAFPAGNYPEASTLRFNISGGATYDSGVAVYDVSPTARISDLNQQPTSKRSGSTLILDTSASGKVSIVACQMVGIGSKNRGQNIPNDLDVEYEIEGATENYQGDARSGEFFVSASAEEVAGRMPYQLSFSSSTKYLNPQLDTSALAVKVEATS